MMQQFIDVMKLFGKRESTTHSWVQDMGALFAVIAISRLSLLVDRSRFIFETILTLVVPMVPG